MGNQDKTIKNLAECREMGISILPPDLNESQSDFSVVQESIRFGMAAVKNVGVKAVESIIQERDAGGPFQDLMDFCRRIDGSKVNRRVLEGLIQCGALDFTGYNRATLLASLDDVIRVCGASQDPNQLNMFDAFKDAGSGAFGALDLPQMDEWDEKEKLKKEKEALGFYVSGHPLDRYADLVKRIKSVPIERLMEVADKTEVRVAGMVENLKSKRTKKGDKMATLSLEDRTGSIPVILFPDVFNQYAHVLKSDDPVIITGTAEVNDNAVKILGKDLASMEAEKQRFIRTLELPVKGEGLSRDCLESLKDLFFTHPGECAVLFRVAMGSGRDYLVAAGPHYRVSPCDALLEGIEAVTEQKVTCRYGNANQNTGKH
jgi:DNA polymerase-3 subunit alpha